MGSRAFGRAVGDTALMRAGRHRLLRNAIAAVSNSGHLDSRGRALLERAATDRRAEVAAQAQFALAQFG
jgi:epoxyqueuosine reductase QueG